MNALDMHEFFSLNNKSEVFATFVQFHAFMCTQFFAKMKAFQSDSER